MLIIEESTDNNWLVVSTPLKNMKVSWEGLSHINWGEKFETTSQIRINKDI